MSDFAGFFCLGIIWLTGVAVGYGLCMMRMRGVPRFTFPSDEHLAQPEAGSEQDHA